MRKISNSVFVGRKYVKVENTAEIILKTGRFDSIM